MGGMLLVSWVSNAAALFVASSALSGVTWGVLAAIIVSIVNGLLHPLLPDPRERRRAPQRA
jgi:uncharacterized membrane protein YvlD (DUF360 family)